MPRKQKKFHYIYKTTNNLSGKYYLGMHSTDNLDDDYIGSGKILWYSINKYGRENHSKEILEYCKNRKELSKRESEIVNEALLKDSMCMNLKYGGEGGCTKECQIKRSRAGGRATSNRLKNDKEFAKKHSKISSINMSKLINEGKIKPCNWTGRQHSDKTKEKMRGHTRQVGSNNSQYGLCWINKDNKNKKVKKEELQNYLDKGWNKGAIFLKLRKK